MRTRTASTTAFALTLTAAAVIGATGRAHAAVDPVTSGTGWKLLAPSVDHIDTRPWTIAFHDTTSRTHLTGYLKNVAAELTADLGVTFTVTSKTVPVTVGTCPPDHTISLRYMSKPDPAHPNRSFTGTCGKGHATYSAYVFVNSDYWSPTRNFAEPVRQNVIWHEMGHAVGLNHPDTCPTDKTGRRPLMCDVNTWRATSTRRYSSFERTAFKRLVTNRAYYPPA